jgi:hypothetical protein
MEIQGKIIQVFEPVTGVSKAGREWTKQEFILETEDDEHPKKICFARMNRESIEKYPISVNSEVIVSFDLDAHEYNGRWFNSVTAWKVNVIESGGNQQTSAPAPPAQPAQPAQPSRPAAQAQAPAPAADNGTEDDLPF